MLLVLRDLLSCVASHTLEDWVLNQAALHSKRLQRAASGNVVVGKAVIQWMQMQAELEKSANELGGTSLRFGGGGFSSICAAMQHC